METVNIRERIKPIETESCFATLGNRLGKYPRVLKAWPFLLIAAFVCAAFFLSPSRMRMAVAAPAPAASGEMPRHNEVLHSSDGLLSIWNYDTDLGGAVPDFVNTVRWWDDRGMHDQVFRNGPERLGWVETVGFLPSVFGNVYVFITADKLTGGERVTGIRAFRLKPGGSALYELERFFPEMPGADAARSRVDWIWRPYAGMAKRPFEVRVNEEARELVVRVTPPPGLARGDAGRFADPVFLLRFNGRELLYQPEGGGVTSARTTARLMEGE